MIEETNNRSQELPIPSSPSSLAKPFFLLFSHQSSETLDTRLSPGGRTEVGPHLPTKRVCQQERLCFEIRFLWGLPYTDVDHLFALTPQHQKSKDLMLLAWSFHQLKSRRIVGVVVWSVHVIFRGVKTSRYGWIRLAWSVVFSVSFVILRLSLVGWTNHACLRAFSDGQMCSSKLRFGRKPVFWWI